MSGVVVNDELREGAHALRQRARRLRFVADTIENQAEQLEQLSANGRVILTGREITHQLIELLEPGDTATYHELHELLMEAGFIAGGVDPPATLLAALARSSAFEQVGDRSGLYRFTP